MAKLNGDPAVASEQSQIERDYQVLKDQYDKLLGDREELRVRSAGADRRPMRSSSASIDPPAAAARARRAQPSVAAVRRADPRDRRRPRRGVRHAQLKPTFATAGRLEKATGLPVIGSISERVSRADAALRRRKLVLFAGGHRRAGGRVRRTAGRRIARLHGGPTA